jgi:hypothetical protein
MNPRIEIPSVLKNKKNVLILLGILIAATLLVTFILILQLKPGESTPGTSTPVTSIPGASTSSVGAKDTLRVTDFLLPEEKLVEESPSYYLLRERLEVWDEKQISQFWYPIHEILADITRRRNEKRLEEVLKGIP